MIIILCVKSDSFLPDKMYSAIFHTCLHALIHIHRSITLHGNSKSPSGQIQQPNCNGLLSQMAQMSFHNPIQDQTKANKFIGKTRIFYSSPDSSSVQRHPRRLGHPVCCTKGPVHQVHHSTLNARCLVLSEVCCGRSGGCAEPLNMLQHVLTTSATISQGPLLY